VCDAAWMEGTDRPARRHSLYPFSGTDDFRIEDFLVEDLRVSSLRSLRSSRLCNDRRFWLAQRSKIACGGCSAVLSPRAMAASQNCITTLVMGRWFSTSSATVQ
jgi:hypothetical protein